MSLQIINPGTVGPSGFSFEASSGVRVSSFDQGYPQVREVVDEQPDRNGSVDYTEFIGSRVVGIELKVIPLLSDPPRTRQEIIDDLRGLCNPALRAYLYYADSDGEVSRRILIRGAGANGIVTAPHYEDVQLQWSCPEGVWESSDENSETGSSVTCTNAGNIRCFPVFTLTGTTMTLSHTQSGLSVVIDHAGGGDVVVDCKNMFVGVDENTPLYEEVDWSLSRWLYMDPGTNDFELTGGTMTVTWRDTWI